MHGTNGGGGTGAGWRGGRKRGSIGFDGRAIKRMTLGRGGGIGESEVLVDTAGGRSEGATTFVGEVEALEGNASGGAKPAPCV